MRFEWSGDVDLNTGDLQQSYQSYRDLRHFISDLDIARDIVENLRKCSKILTDEKEFLVKGLL